MIWPKRIPGLKFAGWVRIQGVNQGKPMVLYDIREPKDRVSINTEQGWNALAERMCRSCENRVFAEQGGRAGAGCADSEE